MITGDEESDNNPILANTEGSATGQGDRCAHAENRDLQESISAIRPNLISLGSEWLFSRGNLRIQKLHMIN